MGRFGYWAVEARKIVVGKKSDMDVEAHQPPRIG